MPIRTLSPEAIQFIASKKYKEFVQAVGKLNKEIQAKTEELNAIKTAIVSVEAESLKRIELERQKLQTERDNFIREKNLKEGQLVNFIVKEEKDLDRKRNEIKRIEQELKVEKRGLEAEKLELKKLKKQFTDKDMTVLEEIKIQRNIIEKEKELVIAHRESLRQELRVQNDEIARLEIKKNELIDYLKKGGRKWLWK